jgi:hypothetical protein
MDKGDKTTIKDPFLGEIELTKVDETNMNLMGESKIDTLFRDDKGNCWINTWTTFGGGIENEPMTYLRKEIVDLIKKHF